jgi:hypothetical protein
MLRLFIVSLILAAVASAHTAFSLATSGCPMAHCNPLGGGVDTAAPPTNTPSLYNNDPYAGMSKGLGCVSNGTYVACTYGGTGGPCESPTDTDPNYLVIYDNSGTIQYCSGNLFDSNASSSVPMMDTAGDVIMSDDVTIALISTPYPTQGGYTHKTALPTMSGSSGATFSPTLIDSGLIVVVATANPGIISAYWADDLTPIASTTVTGSGSGSTCSCTYETTNTPAASNVSNTRFYVSMNGIGTGNNVYGLLVALDVDTSTPAINQDWAFPFGGPSGSSPVVIGDVVYFDGSNPWAGYMISGVGWYFAVEDLGGSSYDGTYWNSVNNSGVEVGGTRIPASGAVDSARGCIWVYALPGDMIYCLDEMGGGQDYSFNVRSISSLTYAIPSSDMSMTQASDTVTVMLLGVVNGYAGGSDPEPAVSETGDVIAVSLSGTTDFMAGKYWSSGDLVRPTVSDSIDATYGQFPLMTNALGHQTIAFPTSQFRARFYDLP